ncbi:DUF883 family protein [Kushneria aurantia]|uniref:YqjD family protein n=1 Tax=Kushneria aurantia TaxID=504092 RepID=A0ABV6G7N2_9GAMM|nr:DUF883 family protein [Kushneria aurantia]
MAMDPVNAPKRSGEASKEQLRDDLRQLTHTIEELMQATADDSRENVANLRQRAEARLMETRQRLSEQSDRVRTQTQDSIECTESYIRGNPWKSVGYSAAAGVIVGLILGRG